MKFNPFLYQDFEAFVYTDDKILVTEIEKLSKQLNFKLYYGGCEEDLVATPFNFAVVDPDKIGKFFLSFFLETYKLDNPKWFSIILTKRNLNSLVIPRNLKKYFIIPKDEQLDPKQLTLTTLNRRNATIRRSKNIRSYDKRIFRLFIILRKLQPLNSLVRMDELCKEFNVSERTISRDIEMLRCAGEDIMFNADSKSFTLNYSFSGLTRGKFKY